MRGEAIRRRTSYSRSSWRSPPFQTCSRGPTRRWIESSARSACRTWKISSRCPIFRWACRNDRHLFRCTHLLVGIDQGDASVQTCGTASDPARRPVRRDGAGALRAFHPLRWLNAWLQYGDYHIPKGAAIFVNLCESRAISTAGAAHSRIRDIPGGLYHDPELFDEPETFDPQRYLRTEFGTKPGVDAEGFRHTMPFGCGRVSLLLVTRSRGACVFIAGSVVSREFAPAFTSPTIRWCVMGGGIPDVWKVCSRLTVRTRHR